MGASRQSGFAGGRRIRTGSKKILRAAVNTEQGLYFCANFRVGAGASDPSQPLAFGLFERSRYSILSDVATSGMSAPRLALLEEFVDALLAIVRCTRDRVQVYAGFDGGFKTHPVHVIQQMLR